MGVSGRSYDVEKVDLKHEKENPDVVYPRCASFHKIINK